MASDTESAAVDWRVRLTEEERQWYALTGRDHRLQTTLRRLAEARQSASELGCCKGQNPDELAEARESYEAMRHDWYEDHNALLGAREKLAAVRDLRKRIRTTGRYSWSIRWMGKEAILGELDAILEVKGE